MPTNTNKYAVTGWGQGGEQDLQLPSGQWVQVRSVSIEDLVLEGLIGKLDFLSAIADDHVKRGQGKVSKRAAERAKAASEQDEARHVMAQLKDDPQGFQQIIQICDQLLVRCVIQPAVHLAWEPDDKGNMVKIPPEDREEGLYTDKVPMMDKMYIFQWVTGAMTNVAPFRAELGESVEHVGDSTDVPVSPK